MASSPLVKRRVLAAVSCGAVSALAGCGADAAPAPEPVELERALPGEMRTRLGDVSVDRVECVYLTESRTRCFAEGRGAQGEFGVPVTVRSSADGLEWVIAQSDVAAVRRGDVPSPVPLGRPVEVTGRDGARVRVEVLEVVDPIVTRHPEVPPKYGSRYLGVRMRLTNDGPSTYEDSPRAAANLRTGRGELLAPAFLTEGECAAQSLESVELEPGETLEGCLAFEVPRDMLAVALQMQLGFSPSVLELALVPATASED